MIVPPVIYMTAVDVAANYEDAPGGQRRAPTIATQGMLAILQLQGYLYRLSCLLCNKIMSGNNNNYKNVLHSCIEVTDKC